MDFNNKNKKIVALAPMAGMTDSVFRSVCHSFGSDYSVSEMVSAKAMCYGGDKTASLAHICADEGSVAIQIFGSEPEFMVRAARMLSRGEYSGCTSEVLPVAIDINMGCPMPKIVNNGEGSALMKNPVLAGKIVEAVVRAVDVPVSVKMRTGWDDEHKNATEFARVLEESGASLVCIHGRTRERMYMPFAEYETIANVKAALKIPVYGNGDIFSCGNAMRMIKDTGVDGVMIGRGALGNPWIFKEIKCAVSGDVYTPPSAAEKIECALLHLKKTVTVKGEIMGVKELRKQLAYYIKGMTGAASIRDRINHAKSYSEVEELMTELLK